MKAVKHPIKHQYQPTRTCCSQTALSMMLGSYDDSITPQDIEDLVPQVRNEDGEKAGSINQQMATWCIGRGYKVTFYTFDCQVIDQSWASLDKKELLERMELRKNGWTVPSLGENLTEQYTQAYIDFVKAGGELRIEQAVTTKLLYELLQSGPVLPCVSFSTLYGTQRVVLTEFEEKKDDVDGRAPNHSIVICGNDEKGNFLIADPDMKPGLHVIEPELMLAAISTAQLECDNLLFQITPTHLLL